MDLYTKQQGSKADAVGENPADRFLVDKLSTKFESNRKPRRLRRLAGGNAASCPVDRKKRPTTLPVIRSVSSRDHHRWLHDESLGIARYLEHRCPMPSLTPEGRRDVARIEQSISVEHSYLAGPVGVLVVQKILGPMFGRSIDEPQMAAARDRIAHVLDVVDAALAEHPYLAGEHFLRISTSCRTSRRSGRRTRSS